MLLDRLEQYGADVKSAMARFLDDEELYVSCFDSFMEDEAFAQLDAALACCEYERAFEAAHTLKGVAGNMGLTPLYGAICNLVEALRVQDVSDLSALHAAVSQQHEALKRLKD